MLREQGIIFDLPLDIQPFGANSSRIGIGVGTPSRIIDLLDSGMLDAISSPIIHQVAVSHCADLSRITVIIQSGTGSG